MFSIEGETINIKSEPIETETEPTDDFDIKCEPESEYFQIAMLSPSDDNINETDENNFTLKSEITFSEYQLGLPDSTVIESPTEQIKHREESNETIACDANGSGKKYACKECDKKFSSKSRFIEHQLIHGEKLFACSECNKRFHLKRVLIEHQRIHTGDKPFACTLCERKFLKKCNLKEHVRIVHNGEKRVARNKFKETIAYDGREKKVPRKRCLNKRNQSEKQFACNECEREFSSKGRLIEHQFSHGEKLFACSECNKRFHLKRVLIEHQRIHTGQKPFACTLCERKFLKKCNLKEHVRIVHDSQSRYTCNRCQKRFWRRDKFELHERMCHTKECDESEKKIPIKCVLKAT